VGCGAQGHTDHRSRRFYSDIYRIHTWLRRGAWNPQIINLPIRLDPLTALANAIASRTWLATSSLALVILLLSVFLGRAWCGWLCPLGTTIDLTQKATGSKQTVLSDKWRIGKYTILLAILFAAVFTNLTLLIFDPVTITFRTLSVSVWPAVDRLVRTAETALYQIPVLQDSLSNIDAFIRPAALPEQPAFYRDAVLFAAIFVGVLLLNRVVSRFWCRYICPLGGLLGLISKLSIFRRRVTQDCKQCGLCAKGCPTGTIRPDKNFSSDPGECIMCMQCVEDCPRQTTFFPASISVAEWRPYDPNRRRVLTTALSTVAALAVIKTDSSHKIEHPHLIQPPGSHENDLLSKCIRCGECSRACPTNAIQPAITEAGLEGLWTPVLIMRLGYCDYSCNACGQVCPVQAIPPLSLPKKRQEVIGIAYIDKNRCIAWAEQRSCIVCEEMCPLPDKAIMLEQPAASSPSAVPDLLLPRVIESKCIGCGICEYKCPVNNTAAIRVYTVSPTSTYTPG
jgi:polyferredoxin